MPIRTNSCRTGRKRRGNLAGSFVVAAGVIAGAWIVGNGRKPEQAARIPAPVVAEFDMVKIPVPLEPVPAGTRVRDIKFKMAAYPKHQVPSGALASLDVVAESATVVALPAELPVFQANFAQAAVASNPVLERIPPGMRAMTVRVDATSAVEGWAGSGSIVDVLLAEKDRTTVIAEKVKVLSAERSVSPVEGASAPSVPTTVTLLVSQEQCLAINTAAPLGKISFVLRSTRDEENWNNTVYTTDRLKGSTPALQERPAIKGYVELKNDEGKVAFALADGEWIRAETKPSGFFALRD